MLINPFGMGQSMKVRSAVLLMLLALSACSDPNGMANQYPALYTTWGVQPYQMRPDGLLTNGLTPVDPNEHF